MKKFVFFLLCQISCYSISAQPFNHTTIKIKTKFYSGKKIFLQGGIYSNNNEFNDFSFIDSNSVEKVSAKIIENASDQFDINVKLNYTHPFQFSYFDTSSLSGVGSYFFFVGKQDVKVKIKDLSTLKNTLRRGMTRPNKEFRKISSLYKEYEDPKTFVVNSWTGKFNVMKNYIARHPNSVVALWDLALHYWTIGKDDDRKMLLEIMQNFSERVQATKTFIALTEKLNQDLQLRKGIIMPSLLFGSSDSLQAIFAKNKYTLVDFWFSSCQPCLNQFEAYKEIYKREKSKGFEIIGISTDSEKRIENWKDVISKFKIDWINYLDTNGIKTESLFIRKFPTNFLVDKNGKILEKDISPAELAAYLKEQL